MFEFSDDKDWVTPHQDNWRRLLGHLVDRPVSMLEIGAYEGRSSLWWIQNILTHSKSILHIVEPRVRPLLVTNLSRLPPGTQWHLHKEHSIDALAFFIVNRVLFDIVYVDGSHEGIDCLTDLLLAERMMAVGGIMIIDDYLWGNPQGTRHHPPKPAVDAFIELNAHRMQVIHKKYQVAIRKTAH
ncbi:MAG: class I SAM-dependent methyltransferase [Verrucomicrobiae bacterium]|nr:class I SAM-dependent methyltransferase [Verrucomicrobiae bacterium]